jgi:hypothetical protein
MGRRGGRSRQPAYPRPNSEIHRLEILRGKEEEPIEIGTRFLVTGVTRAWVHWVNGKPEYHVYDPDQRMPDREELGDLDKKDKEDDPWQNTRLVYLIAADVTAESFTFITKSKGGRGAVADLGDSIMRMRRVHPEAQPIIELQAAKMPTDFGMKSKPVLKIVSWATVDVGATPAPIEKQITHQQAKQEIYRQEIGDDEVPF